jgi:peptidoglycan/LPS O-acetylase OafA/YrhL
VSVVTDHSRISAGGKSPPPSAERRFRPDVQGLRAIAILLVVLFHADIPGITGGYVGVDVFFVISGFVITGVLLRERESKQRTSILNFYGRRARRIIPAASLVIIVVVVAAFHYLAPLTGHATAVDGQWAALFLANFHFAASETNYLASQRPPSALQNYWSLAVEEQFYIVYPTVFLITARLGRRFSLRARLGGVLFAVVVASYAYSIILTSTNAPSAFFSPLTRAWELALGGLIAVSGPSLRRVPQRLAAMCSWLGLAAIVVASVTLTSASVYPGALVALPVVGAGLIIAGGAGQPAWGAEYILRRRPFQLLGLISYSLYLWHWPVLVIATQSRNVSSLPVWENVLLLLFATLLAVVTYRLLENPVRHSRILRSRRWASIIVGLCLIGATLAVTSYERSRPVVDLGSIASASAGTPCPSPKTSVVSQLRSSYAPGHPQPTKQSDLRSVVVIGDSTSCTLLPGLEAVGPTYGMKFGNGAVIGCGIVSGELAPDVLDGVNFNAGTKECQGVANRAESEAIEHDNPSLIVWGSTDERSSIVDDTGGKSRVLVTGTPEWRSVMLGRINTRVDQLLATGASIILLQQPPFVHAGGSPETNADDRAFGRMNQMLGVVAAAHPGKVAVVNLSTRVCPSGPPCPYVVDGFGATVATAAQSIRPDGEHYLPPASLWVARWLVPEVFAAAKGLPR